MSGFDAIPEDIRNKLTAKKYDRLQRLPPIDQKDRWDRLMEKCELEDYEVNEILNAIKSPARQTDNALIKKVVVEALLEQKSSKSRKGGGSQMSAKDYDDGSYDTVAFEFDPLANKFIEEELVQLKTKLDETTKRIRDKLLLKKNPSEYRVGSTKRGDEISIVQPEVEQLCASLCELYDRHYNEKLSYRAELKYADINVDIPDPPVSSSSSSAAVPTKRTNRSGRIDFTFHNRKLFAMQALGLLECKNTLKEFYANGNLTTEAKKALAQAFVQLKSQINNLTEKTIRPLLYVSLLTTGKKWIVLQRGLYEGTEIFTHSYECLLLDEDDQFVENYEENLKEVTNMLFYLLFSMSVVNKTMKSQMKKFQYHVNNDDEDDNDDDESRDDEDDEKSHEDYKEPDDTVRTDSNRLAGNKRTNKGTNGDNSNKKFKSANLHNSWKYAPLTTENLLKYQQLIE